MDEGTIPRKSCMGERHDEHISGLCTGHQPGYNPFIKHIPSTPKPGVLVLPVAIGYPAPTPKSIPVHAVSQSAYPGPSQHTAESTEENLDIQVVVQEAAQHTMHSSKGRKGKTRIVSLLGSLAYTKQVRYTSNLKFKLRRTD